LQSVTTDDLTCDDLIESINSTIHRIKPSTSPPQQHQLQQPQQQDAKRSLISSLCSPSLLQKRKSPQKPHQKQKLFLVGNDDEDDGCYGDDGLKGKGHEEEEIENQSPNSSQNSHSSSQPHQQQQQQQQHARDQGPFSSSSSTSSLSPRQESSTVDVCGRSSTAKGTSCNENSREGALLDYPPYNAHLPIPASPPPLFRNATTNIITPHDINNSNLDINGNNENNENNASNNDDDLISWSQQPDSTIMSSPTSQTRNNARINLSKRKRESLLAQSPPSNTPTNSPSTVATPPRPIRHFIESGNARYRLFPRIQQTDITNLDDTLAISSPVPPTSLPAVPNILDGDDKDEVIARDVIDLTDEPQHHITKPVVTNQAVIVLNDDDEVAQQQELQRKR